jgi:hypothetical protein
MPRAIDRNRPPQRPSIEIVGLHTGRALDARITRQLRRALIGVQSPPVRARVSFRDVNGPKGGLDVRCAIDVRIPRAAPLHAEQTAGDQITAFDQSAAAISRQIASRLERRQDRGRYPKKYYAARRAM